jgi:head-tail adaptor
MAYFNTGSLDTLVTINSCVITMDAEGGKKYSFPKFRDVYANVDRRVSEQVSIGNLEGGDYISLTIYKIPELDSTWQVVVESRKYEITAIDLGDRLSPFCTLTLHAVD